MWHPFCFYFFDSLELPAAFLWPGARALIFRYSRFDLPVLYDVSAF